VNALALGIQFMLIILMFLGLGYYLDERYRMKFPLFLIIFFFMGFGSALYILIRATAVKKNDKSE